MLNATVITITAIRNGVGTLKTGNAVSSHQCAKAIMPDEFEKLLKKWYGWITRCQLPAMVKVAKTIKRHWDGILRWKESQINNGLLEGLNSGRDHEISFTIRI